MKTISILHKALVLLALLCINQVSWGQVTGNKYKPVGNTVFDATLVAGTGWENDYKNAYDKNDNTFAKQADHNVNPTLTFSLDGNTLTSIQIVSLGERNEPRPEQLIIESRNSNSGSWTSVQTFTFSRQEERENVTLNTPITSNYVRLTFVVSNDIRRLVQINEVSFYDNTNSAIIQHKEAKWFDLQGQLGLSNQSVGSFDWNKRKFAPALSLSKDSIQAAHTYIDTIYMHKGASITLSLPTKSGTAVSSSSSAQTYQRWYSYRTDGTFETNHDDNVYDLLTPSGATNVYRFTNGYVGRPLGNIVQGMSFYYPTNEEFKKWFPNSKVDNDWFVVACDVSGYTDFTEHFRTQGNDGNTKEDGGITRDEIIKDSKERFENNGYYEPTIALRVIYYIVGVDDRDNKTSESKKNNWEGGHGRLSKAEYQEGGLNTSGKRYLEEYDITFPSAHLSNYTDELVALSKDARSYAIPGAGKSENVGLDIEMASTEDRLSLITTALSGENRIIKFRKAGVGENTPWTVPDGTTATIYVTKTYNRKKYNIARFTLTFVADAIPLTQTQVSKLGTAGSEAWKKYTYRSPKWMQDNLQKLTELTFDYDPNATKGYGQEEYFHFPLAWDNSSYAFFDGSPWQDFASNDNYTIGSRYYWYPEFGYYAITNDYIGWGDQKGNGARPSKDTDGVELAKGASRYHIYVDASDRPGILARLPFDEKLCQGSELYVSAWMKSAGSETNDDAAVLFTVLGVDGDGNETPIYRHSSGQIRTTTWLEAGDPGTGSGTNDWYQLYFSFLNNDDKAADFVSYILQIENNSASTTGGDYYLDDIKVYLMQPTAKVTQKEYTCTNERTRMSIEMDWERLTARLGVSEGSENASTEEGISFCFIDETTYNNYLKEHSTGDDVADRKAAIDASIVKIGDGNVIDTRLMSLYFFTTFDKNDEIGHSTFPGAENDTIEDGHYYFAYQHMKDGKPYFYRVGSTADTDGRRLTVDFYSVLTPNRPYLMLIVPADQNLNEDALLEYFATQIGDRCRIVTRFYVASETLIKVNGEVVNPSTDFCEGQIFNFSAQLRYPTGVDENGNQTFKVIDSGVYYDWFFGSEEEYLAANTEFGGGESLQSALTTFRAAYPDATDLNMADTPWGEITVEVPTKDGGIATNTVNFKEDQYNLIEHYLKTGVVEGGINSRLVLHRENLDITLLEGGLKLIVQPIQTLAAPEESGISDDQCANICWEYVPLLLTANDRAPQLYAGFNTVQYPAKDFAPDLRIGLAQIKKAKSKGEAIRVDLRGAQVVTGGATHLGVIADRNDIYLIGSDDPEYAHYFASADFNRYSLPIGKIEELYAEEYESGSKYNDHMNITFNLGKQPNGFQFNPKEGYTYMFSAYFEEKGDASSDVYNTCYGSLNIEMKVVPENLVWQGTEKDNWNNDANWKRADASDLKIKGGSYTTNDANTTSNGFVPMLFSNVIMPTDSKAELYMAGYTAGGEDLHQWAVDKRPDGMGNPTENIQYDLMVYEADKALTTQRYRVNICRDIHFMPGAQMLHAEQLIYNKAWTDVTVPTKKWTLISTPLRDVYAGDWYTTTKGTQADEVYFKDINFDDKKNDRLNPTVYQRSWNEKATIVEKSTTATNVAFSPLWSAVYNDASVPYTAGGGFSIKAAEVNEPGAKAGSLLFRLPKADAKYDYSTGEISRENSGKLLISGLLDRSAPLELKRYDSVETTLSASQDDGGKYMIVGNPYMACLDMKKFMAVNQNLDGNYWTETEDGPVVGSGAGDNWLSTDGNPVIKPYGAFFVKLKDGADDTKVSFTADMQTLATVDGGQSGNAGGLTITASAGGRQSGAVLAYADTASDGFNEGEDALLMTDLAGNKDEGPEVYTVAGSTATAVNRVKEARRIPMGVFAGDGTVTTLTFTGTSTLRNPRLYDAATRQETPLSDGYQLELNGASHGRYFIVSDGPVTSGVSVSNASGSELCVYSVTPGEVIVSASVPMRLVRVYSAAGAAVRSVDAGGSDVCRILGVGSGVVVVSVELPDGSHTRKIVVK